MPLSGTTILTVDDNPAHNYALVRVLQHAHANVLTATTGEEALRLAAQKPALIVLDVNLPDISGFEVCRRLRRDKRTAKTPIVFHSASCQDSAAVNEGERAGGNAFLFDPIEPNQLVATVAGHIRRSQMPDRE